MARRPKIAAPPGHKGCPDCLQVLPLVDPISNKRNFAASGYCHPCASKRISAYRARARDTLIAAGAVEPRPATAAYGIMKIDPTSAHSEAHVTAFPELKVPPIPQCSCCHRQPTQQVSGLPFCGRCAYYVAACGRCCEHSYREFVPGLLGRPDPALLPPVAYTREWRLPRGAVQGRDETDLVNSGLITG